MAKAEPTLPTWTKPQGQTQDGKKTIHLFLFQFFRSGRGGQRLDRGTNTSPGGLPGTGPGSCRFFTKTRVRTEGPPLCTYVLQLWRKTNENRGTYRRGGSAGPVPATPPGLAVVPLIEPVALVFVPLFQVWSRGAKPAQNCPKVTTTWRTAIRPARFFLAIANRPRATFSD